MLISPQGRKYEFSLPIVATSTNNHAEYQALIKGWNYLGRYVPMPSRSSVTLCWL
jgi:ribonuclease HI